MAEEMGLLLSLLWNTFCKQREYRGMEVPSFVQNLQPSLEKQVFTCQAPKIAWVVVSVSDK